MTGSPIGHRSTMTEQPDPTKDLDLSEVDAGTPEEAAMREGDLAEGDEAGWDDGGDVSETHAPGEGGVGGATGARPAGPAPGGRIAGEHPAP
jgi:hypothetical protein